MPHACAHCGAQLAVGAIACFRCGRMVGRPEEAESGPSLVVAGTQLGTVAKAQLLEDQWRLVDLIGRGQTGEVWRAHDVQLDRGVAVKLMHPERAADPQQVARFEREARVLAGLEHPNLLPVLGLGRVGERPFLVTRLLEGKTLAEAMHARGGKLPPAEAARILVPICDALAVLHASGIDHRDVKPSHVFVGDDQRITLMDLGSELESGTAGYVSPEQRLGTRTLDGKADVYAVGCLLREALTGALSPVERTVPGVPVALLELARAATAIDPSARPTAAELKAKLAPYLVAEESTAPMATPVAEPATQGVVFTPTTGSPEYPHLRALPTPGKEKETREAPAEPPRLATSSTQILEKPVVSSTLVLPKSAAVREQPTAPRLSQSARGALGVGAFALTAAFGLGLLEREPEAPPPVRIDRPNVPVTIQKEDTAIVIQNVEPPKETRIVPALPNLAQRKDDLYTNHGYRPAAKRQVDRSPVAYGFLRITTVIGQDVVTAHVFRKRKGAPERYDRIGHTPIDIRVVPGPLELMFLYENDPPHPHTFLVLDRKDWKKEKGGMQEVVSLRSTVYVEESESQGERVGKPTTLPAGQRMTGLRGARAK